jgi:geranylgeranyl pyrophosphate synthase
MTIQTINNQSAANLYTSFSIDDLIQQVDCLIQNTFLKQTVSSLELNICIEAVKYHFDSPGQQVRAKTCLDACMKLGVQYEDMLILAAAAELLHNASLIHDDIQDPQRSASRLEKIWY